MPKVLVILEIKSFFRLSNNYVLFSGEFVGCDNDGESVSGDEEIVVGQADVASSLIFE